MWAANLEAKRDEAIAITDEANYDRFMRYLTGCADFFRRSISDIAQYPHQVLVLAVAEVCEFRHR